MSEKLTDQEVAPSQDNKEFNFERLRRKAEAAEKEAQRIRQEKEEIELERQRQREENEALRRRLEEIEIERRLSPESEEPEDPTDYVSIGKLREKDKKAAARQAAALQKQTEELKEALRQEMREEQRKLLEQIERERLNEEAINLFKIVGKEQLEKELESDELFRDAVQYMPEKVRLQHIKKHFEKKAEAARLLQREASPPQTTGISNASAVPPTPQSLGLTKVKAEDWLNPEKAREMSEKIKTLFSN